MRQKFIYKALINSKFGRPFLNLVIYAYSVLTVRFIENNLSADDGMCFFSSK